MKLQAVISALHYCPLFNDVPEKEIELLLTYRGTDVQTYAKNRIIAFRGDVHEKLLIVLEGSLSAEFQDYTGKVFKVETLRRGEIIGSAILFSSSRLLPVTLVTAEDCRLLVIPRRVIVTFVARSEQFLLNLLSDMGAKLEYLAEKLYVNQFASIRQKIAGYLLDQSNRQNSESVALHVTKETLSEIFGVARPSLSRCFSELVKTGVIKQEGTIIHIIEREELEDILEEE